ncbi:MAG: hypothetical protein KGR26_09910 [Cyanobacteria bacterium REEB65]|nr:hypothetical protein [Cyanobacteria bacterium REEB65]
MSKRPFASALVLTTALLSLGATAAVAQDQAPVPSGNPAIAQPGPNHPGNRRQEFRRGQGRRRERHQAMMRAMRALTVAENALNRAEHDFKGHRAAALDLVRRAKAEVKAGLQADRQ